MKMKIKIAPSILAADFTRLGEEIKQVEEAGADLLHLDIMDGHFVPNISFGPPVVTAVRSATSLYLEAHLMILNPDKFIPAFAEAGVERIIIHAEDIPDFPQTLNHIRNLGLKAGISLKPQTPLDPILSHLSLLDTILFMTVEPGFGGQAFMPQVLSKIRAGADFIARHGYPIDIGVDGGIEPGTASQVIAAGANLLIAGTSIFGNPNKTEAISRLRNPG
ncbi:ribulose-phosphate 3-epimerase [bacterium]|nr:ribulose-phosphate 3-epimerase [bacterium]